MFSGQEDFAVDLFVASNDAGSIKKSIAIKRLIFSLYRYIIRVLCVLDLLPILNYHWIVLHYCTWFLELISFL